MIGPATEADLRGVVELLNHSSAHSHASFLTEPTSVVERRDWFAQFADAGPTQMLVARSGAQLLGFACTQRYRELFDRLAREPVHSFLAGIALPNDASVALRRRLGYLSPVRMQRVAGTA